MPDSKAGDKKTPLANPPKLSSKKDDGKIPQPATTHGGLAGASTDNTSTNDVDGLSNPDTHRAARMAIGQPSEPDLPPGTYNREAERMQAENLRAQGREPEPGETPAEAAGPHPPTS